MPAWILKLMPWRDWAYAAIAAVALVAYNVHVHNLIVKAKAQEIAAVAAASGKVKAAALVEMQRQTDDYNAKLADTEKTFAQHTQDADAAHDADLKRLQQLANSYRDANRALQGAAGAGGKPDTAQRPPGTDDMGSLPRGLGVPLRLADALRFDDALLAACRSERDALTGK